jgi:hypothetical protein
VSRFTGRGAFAELAVVVVGILIALGVDGWNERRLERATEVTYLDALVRDLAADTTSLSGLISSYHIRRQAAQRVLDAVQSSHYEGTAAELAWDVNVAGYITSFDPTDFTYRELMATGGLGLLRDADLKRDLIAYYQAVDLVAQFYPLWHAAATEDYNPLVRRRVSATDWRAIELSRGRPDDLPIDTDGVLRRLAEDGDVQKILVTMTVSAGQQIASWERLQGTATDLLIALSDRD